MMPFFVPVQKTCHASLSSSLAHCRAAPTTASHISGVHGNHIHYTCALIPPFLQPSSVNISRANNFL